MSFIPVQVAVMRKVARLKIHSRAAACFAHWLLRDGGQRLLVAAVLHPHRVSEFRALLGRGSFQMQVGQLQAGQHLFRLGPKRATLPF